MTTLAEIIQRQAVCRGGLIPALSAEAAVPTGHSGLDAELPGGGSAAPDGLPLEDLS